MIDVMCSKVVCFVCRTALRLHLDGEQLATQLLMTSAWSEAAVNVIREEWTQQVLIFAISYYIYVGRNTII